MNDKNWNRIKWCSLTILFLVLFLTCLYDDLLTTYIHSLNFLECLFSGNFLGFYEYTLTRTVFNLPADYYILIYIIFGIWVLPIWLLGKIISFDPFVVPAVLWTKMILVPFVLGVLYIVYKMLEMLREDNAEHTIFMICSSLLFVLPIGFMGQYDVISLFLILLGIYQCMKDQKVSWKAVGILSIAVPIKVLAIFPVILIILIQEKRIFEIIKKVLASFIPLVLCILPFAKNAAFHEALTNNGGWFDKCSAAVLHSGWNGISIFWLMFFGLCLIAFRMKQHDLKDYFKQLTWILTAFYGFFFIFVEAHPQWSVLLVPFMALMIREEDSNLLLNGLLDTIAGVALVLSQTYYFNWVYFTDRTSWLLLDWITNKGNKLCLVSLGDISLMEKSITVINAGYFTAVVALLIINNPWKKVSDSQKVSEQEIRLNKMGISTIRILAILGYIAVTALITYVL